MNLSFLIYSISNQDLPISPTHGGINIHSTFLHLFSFIIFYFKAQFQHQRIYLQSENDLAIVMEAISGQVVWPLPFHEWQVECTRSVAYLLLRVSTTEPPNFPLENSGVVFKVYRIQKVPSVLTSRVSSLTWHLDTGLIRVKPSGVSLRPPPPPQAWASRDRGNYWDPP